MSKILIADNSRSMRESVASLFEAEFHTVDRAVNGVEAEDLYQLGRPDVIILETTLPIKSGIEVCRSIRSGDQSTAIIFLSSKKTETDIVLGLGVGADDYLSKPFGSHELVARVNALIRRQQHSKKLLSASAGHDPFNIGFAVIDGNQVTSKFRSNFNVQISRREYSMLRFMKNNEERVVRRDELMSLFEGCDSFSNRHAFDQQLSLLRRKIGGMGFDIVTVRPNGLKLNYAKLACPA